MKKRDEKIQDYEQKSRWTEFIVDSFGWAGIEQNDLDHKLTI